MAIDIGTDEVIEGISTATFRFKRLKDRKPGESWILMIYGPTKSGKTYFCGTAGPRTLFINIGSGIETLLSPAFKNRYPESADMLTVDIREDNPKSVAEAFDNVTKVITHALNNFPDLFDTIVLDDATSFNTFAMNKAMELVSSTRTEVRGNKLETFVMPEPGDYNFQMQMVEQFLAQLVPMCKDAGKHFILTAHERRIYEKPQSKKDAFKEPVLKRVLPAFAGSTFPDKVPAFFDDVFRTEVVGGGENKVYRMRTAGTEKEVAGARHGGIFKASEDDPNFLKMLERIRTGVKK